MNTFVNINSFKARLINVALTRRTRYENFISVLFDTLFSAWYDSSKYKVKKCKLIMKI